MKHGGILHPGRNRGMFEGDSFIAATFEVLCVSVMDGASHHHHPPLTLPTITLLWVWMSGPCHHRYPGLFVFILHVTRPLMVRLGWPLEDAEDTLCSCSSPVGWGEPVSNREESL